MLKLDGSKDEAFAMAKKHPDNFQAGSNAWVTLRFGADDPPPTELWTRWLDESYALSAPPAKKPRKKKALAKK